MPSSTMPATRTTKAFADEEARWAAVMRRDTAADGAFVTAVRTTGVYCRPSCTARHPNRANVSFHETRAAAELAGFRPCKRCRPGQPDPRARRADTVKEACRTIEAAEEPPAPDELARAAGLSPFHFHRLFTAATGVTPKAYADALRERKRALLEREAKA
jgi:AraC family transcriptional regulator of adaptative response/methylated-DNA-[protein]-cysteine methyltransferase